MGIYKRKQVVRKKRKQALDQESDQEKNKNYKGQEKKKKTRSQPK